jgi:hypothetical protein
LVVRTAVDGIVDDEKDVHWATSRKQGLESSADDSYAVAVLS